MLLRADIDVTGLDLADSWWTSPYSPMAATIQRTFIRSDRPVTAQTLRYATGTSADGDGEFALLFCYFNDRAAFEAYVRVYEGRWVILVGACAEMDELVVTDPRPWELAGAAEWRIVASVLFDREINGNVAVIYERKRAPKTVAGS